MTTKKIYQIAIDGPSGAGKSTIARLVAQKLGIDYIDTGAMYRALGLKMLRQGLPMTEDARLLAMLADTDIDFAGGRVYLDGEDVSDLIRTQEISKAASDEERAMRRYRELAAKGASQTYEEVLAQIRQRDYNDTHRAVTPLRKADDAVAIDSTAMRIEEVVDFICGQIA